VITYQSLVQHTGFELEGIDEGKREERLIGNHVPSEASYVKLCFNSRLARSLGFCLLNKPSLLSPSGLTFASKWGCKPNCKAGAFGMRVSVMDNLI
jgi:hypothetical protein